MSKLNIELDDEEFYLLKTYMKEHTIDEWRQLEGLKNNCPVIVIDRNYGSYNGDLKYYSTKDNIIKTICDENRALINRLNEYEKTSTLKSRIVVSSTVYYGFFDRIKILFTGKCD